MLLKNAVFLAVLIYLCKADIHKGGILYPRESETRQVVSLNGIWNFVVPNNTSPFVGFEYYWYKKSLKEVRIRLCCYFILFGQKSIPIYNLTHDTILTNSLLLMVHLYKYFNQNICQYEVNYFVHRSRMK